MATDEISTRAIAGTHVVLLGMNADSAAADGLLGFAIERTDHTENERRFLPNFLLFEANDRGADSDHSSFRNPLQAFLWGDYTAKPDHAYTYRVIAMYGTPKDLSPGDEVEVDIVTESVASGAHAIFFNRGAATSQAYVTKFGHTPPDKVPDRAAYTWLSRGLEEAMLSFIGQATSQGWGLRAAVYEFEYAPALQAFGAAADRGVDVKIVYDAVDNSTPKQPVPQPATDNKVAIEATDIERLCTPRRNTRQIPHNKFVVLLRDGEPVEVWTGSTNVTAGGIFGHSNVGHVVRDRAVARSYLAYWQQLSGDPDSEELEPWNEERTKVPEGLPPPNSIGTVFSPRKTLAALEWYAGLMDRARSSVFLTAAFGVSEQLRRVFGEDKRYLRYLLLDNRNGRIETIAREIAADPDNLVTAGAYIGKGGWRQWVEENVRTKLNRWVQFIHTKYMLIDPLGDDPIVITGSANFSEPSTTGNDENMLVIRGDRRVADVYLGEFMRLFSHFRLRGRTKAKQAELAPGPALTDTPADRLYLRPNDQWTRRFYVEGSAEAKERLLFGA